MKEIEVKAYVVPQDVFNTMSEAEQRDFIFDNLGVLSDDDLLDALRDRGVKVITELKEE